MAKPHLQTNGKPEHEADEKLRERMDAGRVTDAEERRMMKMIRMESDWVSERHLLHLRRNRRHDFFITFRHQQDTADPRWQCQMDRNVIAIHSLSTARGCEYAEDSHNRHVTSSSGSLPLQTTVVTSQRNRNRVTCSAQNNDFQLRSQASVGRWIERGFEGEVVKGGGGEHITQLSPDTIPAGDVLESPRVVGLPGKEWIRLVRANPEDRVLRRLDMAHTTNSLSTASFAGRLENRSVGSSLESSSGCGSLTGRRFPTLQPRPAQGIRSKPSNTAIGVGNRSSVSSLFQQSCEKIFTSNRCSQQWSFNGNDLLYDNSRFQQQRKEEEEVPARLAGHRLVRIPTAEFDYLTSKTPNNSPEPEDAISEVMRQKDFVDEDRLTENDGQRLTARHGERHTETSR